MLVFNQYTDSFCGYKFGENGNEHFKAQLDGIDLGEHTEPEYRDAKLLLLAMCIHPNKDEAQINAFVFGRILIYGVQGALDTPCETIFPCTAGEKLGVTPESFVADVKRNRAKIEHLRPILMGLGNIKTMY